MNPRCDQGLSFFHGMVQGLIAGEQAGFHDIGGHRDVPGRLIHALIDGAHTVADLQLDIPEQGEEGFQAFTGLIVFRYVEQDH